MNDPWLSGGALWLEGLVAGLVAGWAVRRRCE